MQTAPDCHDHILRDAIASHNGHVLKTGGDSFCCVFAQPANAVAAALAAQRWRVASWANANPSPPAA